MPGPAGRGTLTLSATISRYGFIKIFSAIRVNARFDRHSWTRGAFL